MTQVAAQNIIDMPFRCTKTKYVTGISARHISARMFWRKLMSTTLRFTIRFTMRSLTIFCLSSFFFRMLIWMRISSKFISSMIALFFS